MADARTKLLDAALKLVREKGYASTTVDDLCAEAGVSKGAFFHHFKDKQALGVAAAQYWSTTTGQRFEAAPYHEPADPLDRLLAYIDFRQSLITGGISEFTCLAGTMVQEVHETSPDIRSASCSAIVDHAATLEDDIALAMERYPVAFDMTPKSLALHSQAVLQGAFILAKATGDPEIAIESVRHLRRYVELLFGRAGSGTGQPQRANAAQQP